MYVLQFGDTVAVCESCRETNGCLHGGFQWTCAPEPPCYLWRQWTRGTNNSLSQKHIFYCLLKTEILITFQKGHGIKDNHSLAESLSLTSLWWQYYILCCVHINLLEQLIWPKSDAILWILCSSCLHLFVLNGVKASYHPRHVQIYLHKDNEHDQYLL